MSHLDEVIARVDAAIEESVIAHMNELLIALSDDAELSREDIATPSSSVCAPLLLITVASIKKIWKRATNS